MSMTFRRVVAFTLLSAGWAAAQDQELATRTQVFVVSGSRLVPATASNVGPGAILEYQIEAVNDGSSTVPAGDAVVTSRIVPGFEYVRGSWRASEEAVMATFSVDGENFYVPPIAFGGTRDRRVYEPYEYRAVRWRVLDPVDRGQVLTFRYRVRVADDDAGGQPAHAPAPSADGLGFRIVSYDMRWEGDTLWVVGEVLNVGAAAAGVELQMIARDATGRLVDVATFWPASTRNIRPGTSYGFRYPVTRERSAVRIEVQVVGSEVW
jgi:hypothetical protein